MVIYLQSVLFGSFEHNCVKGYPDVSISDTLPGQFSFCLVHVQIPESRRREGRQGNKENERNKKKLLGRNEILKEKGRQSKIKRKT